QPGQSVAARDARIAPGQPQRPPQPLSRLGNASPARPEPGQRGGDPQRCLGVSAENRPGQRRPHVVELPLNTVEPRLLAWTYQLNLSLFRQPRRPLRVVIPHTSFLTGVTKAFQTEFSDRLQHPDGSAPAPGPCRPASPADPEPVPNCSAPPARTARPPSA